MSNGSAQQKGRHATVQRMKPKEVSSQCPRSRDSGGAGKTFTRAIELFSNECAAGLTVLHRLAIRQRLSSPNTVELFLELNKSERSAYVASIVAEVATSGNTAPEEQGHHLCESSCYTTTDTVLL